MTATVREVVEETARVKSIVLDVPAWPGHRAGQHVDVRLTAPDGYQAQRSYSIASAPGREPVELAIERLEDGEVSPYFHDVAQAGDAFEVRGPIGGPVLLVGGGSGVVPLMAIERHRAAAAPATEALLVYSARTRDELIFRDELLDRRKSDRAFTLVLTTTREPRRDGVDFDRRLDRALLREILAGWQPAPRHVYVCGANDFVEAVTGALVAEALDPRIIRAERYGGTT